MSVLKQIKLPGQSGAIPISSTVVNKSATANGITVTSANTDISSGGNPTYTIGLNIDGKTIVNGTSGLESGLQLVYHKAKTEGDVTTTSHIALTDKDGNELSIIDISSIVGSGIVKSGSYDPSTGKLTITFATESGTSTVDIDLGALLDFNDVVIKEGSSNYLSFEATKTESTSQAQFGAKLSTITVTTNEDTPGILPEEYDISGTVGIADGADVASKVKTYVTKYVTDSIAAVSPKNLNATKTSTDGENVQVKVTEKEGLITAVNITTDNTVNSDTVDAKIKSAFDAIDVNYPVETGKVVTAVAQNNGLVSQTNAEMQGIALTGFSESTTATGAITATDTLGSALNKLQNKVNSAATSSDISTAIGKLDATVTSTDGTNVNVTITETDGKISAVTVNDKTQTAIGNKISTAITNLKYTDSSETGKVVTAVSEASGLVSPTKTQMQGIALTGFTTSTSTTGAIAATDTLGSALNKLQNKVDAVVQYKVTGTTLEFFNVTEKTT